MVQGFAAVRSFHSTKLAVNSLFWKKGVRKVGYKVLKSFLSGRATTINSFKWDNYILDLGGKPNNPRYDLRNNRAMRSKTLFRKMFKYSKKLSRGMTPIALVISGLNIGSACKDRTGQKCGQTVSGEIGGFAGAWALGKAGVVACFWAGPYAAICGVVGGIVGYFGGTWVGKQIHNRVINPLERRMQKYLYKAGKELRKFYDPRTRPWYPRGMPGLD